MAVTVKFQPIERDLVLQLAGTDEEKSAYFAAFAKEEIDKAEKINESALGRAVSYETIVDGVKTDNLGRVRPDGVIVANFDLGTDLVQWIWEMLQKHSPVLKDASKATDGHAPGRYKASHIIYADGVKVDEPKDIPPSADVIVITSVVPYARKIERGLSSQAPKGVYNDATMEGVAAMAKARYSNQAKIRFTYQSPIGGGTMLEHAASTHASKENGAAKQRRAYQKYTRQPAIMILFK